MATDVATQSTVLEQRLLHFIRSTGRGPGDKLPRVADLAKELGVGYGTMHRAVASLCDAGVLSARPKAGTFVRRVPAAEARILAEHAAVSLVLTRGFLEDFSRGLLRATLCGVQDAIGQGALQLKQLSDLPDESALRSLELAAAADTRQGHLLVSVPSPVKSLFHRLGAPAVVLGEIDPLQEQGIELAAVDVDSRAIMLEVMQRLWAAGHRRIALFMRGVPTGGALICPRTYKQFLIDQGAFDSAADSRLSRPTPHERGPFQELMGELLGSPDRPTAVICDAGLHSIWSIHAAADRGLRIPQDLAIVSLRDDEMCEHHRPAVTAVSHPQYAIGFEAGQLLLRAMGGEDIRKIRKSLPHRLIKRETT